MAASFFCTAQGPPLRVLAEGLLVPLTNLSTAMKTTLTGLFIAGVPEILTVLAVAVMGKAGFTYAKNLILAVAWPALFSHKAKAQFPDRQLA